jgi:hypothetical protein
MQGAAGAQGELVVEPAQRAVRDPLIGLMAAHHSGHAKATTAAQRAGIEHAKQRGGTPSVRFFPHLSLFPWLQRIRCWAGKAPSYARGLVIKLDLTGDGQLRQRGDDCAAEA